MYLFFHPKLDHSVARFRLDPDESRHLVKVLRKKEGDKIYVTNGKGQLFTAEIHSIEGKQCEAQIVSVEKKHRKMHWLHLVVAPTKMKERYEWFLEKATEIGVDEITPIICEHSERKMLKVDRMERVVQAAMKQSLQTYLPTINPVISFSDFLAKKHEGLLFIAHCGEEERVDLKRRVTPDKDITILIGPEGDFSKSELKEALEKGFWPVSLGENRLRTETAALVACTTVNIINSG